MFSKATLIAVLAAVGASASTLNVPALLTRSEHAPLLSRQITPAQIPAACQSQCTSALTIYQACTTGNTATCISVCQPSNYSGFVGCLQCVLNNTPGVSTAETAALNTIITQLAGACQQAGTPVSATSFVVSATGSRTGTPSGSGSGSSSASSTSTTSSVSRTSSLTGTGVISSATSLLTSAAAATSSRAAGQVSAVLPQGFQAVVLGLAGVGAGAAMLL